MEPLDHQVAFLLEADRLKTVLRQSTLTDRSRRENSAEHSWHLALMALVLAEYAPPGLDLQRVLAMVVLHDLVEIDAGDLFAYATPDELARQERAEHAAADRLFGLLPPGQSERFHRIWDEFEERVSPEAKFARAMDRLQPMLINMVTGGGTWLAHGVTADQVLTRAALIADGSPALGRLARDMIARAVAGGLLAPGPAGQQPGWVSVAGRIWCGGSRCWHPTGPRPPW
jgi:putative hydrolases of HD superfamily